MRSILLAATILALSASAFAERTAQQWVTTCGLTGTAGSIVADVYNAAAAGSLVATIPNGSFTRVAGTSDCYTANLAAASGISYPATNDATEKHYLVRARDDASNEVWVSATVVGTVGSIGDVPEACKKPTKVYATSPIPSRGITQTLINERRPSYVKVEVACDRDFASPDSTYYLHMYYDSTGRISYELPALVVPNP